MAIQSNFPAIRPTLDLNFASSRTVDPRIAFTRASTATYFDEFGVMRTAPANTPRIDFDPVTGECKGLLIEEQRVRLNVVSAAPTAAESITVTAVAHTISFYGTGSVTLSGAYSATVTGTGAFPTLTTLTFTPTAGTLTITPSDTVQHLQIEAGSFATSVIQGEGSQVTRAADSAAMTGSNFSSWYRQDEGTLYAEFQTPVNMVANRCAVSIHGGSTANYFSIGTRVPTAVVAGQIRVSGGTHQSVGGFGAGAASFIKTVFAAKSGDFAISANGAAVTTNTSIMPYDLNTLFIGGLNSTTQPLTIRKLSYYPKRLSNAQLQAITT